MSTRQCLEKYGLLLLVFVSGLTISTRNGLAQQPGTIITFAGGGGITDGFPATEANLSNPQSVFVDGSGNIYIADTEQNRVRKIDASGIITTVAGNGTSAFSSDGGPATEASISRPGGIFVDDSSNIYIAEQGTFRVRKVDSNGIITTLAGNGSFGFSGDGGQATETSLRIPIGVFVDRLGNVYIADLSDHRIRKVDTNGIITTVAGNGTGGFSGDGGQATEASINEPSGVFVDDSLNIYIADSENNRVRKVDPNGIITTVAGNGIRGFSGDGGEATLASLFSPRDIFVDNSRNLYIADRFNQRVRKVDSNGIITTIAGNGFTGFSGDGGPATLASLTNPFDVFVDGSDNVFIADFFNHSIRKVDNNGIITTVAGNGFRSYFGDGGQAAQARLDQPAGVFEDGSGKIFIADQLNHRIRKVDPNGIITTVAGNGIRGFSGDGGQATEASLNFPADVFVDSTGNIYISDYRNHRIRKVDMNGIITTVAGTGSFGFRDGGPATQALLNFPTGVFVDGSGNLYISDQGNHRVRFVDSNGIISTIAGDGNPDFSGDGDPATEASLSFPDDVFVDGTGNIYIAGAGSHRIRKVDTNGIITTVAGNGLQIFAGDGGQATETSIRSPRSVFVNGSGNIYISDNGNHRIRKVDRNGIINTVAGNGIRGFSGDGNPATQAALAEPQGIFLDGFGNIYIADFVNNRIRKVIAFPPPVADAGPDTAILVGQSVSIGGSPTASGGKPPLTISWSPSTGLDDSSAANPIASPDTTTEYILTVTDDQGEIATDSVKITVLPQQQADISLPDTSGRQNTLLSVPITVETDSAIGLAQFVIEFDSNLVSFESAQITTDIPGFSLSQINDNLPFPATDTENNKNVLIQISGGGIVSFTGKRKVVDVTFKLVGAVGTDARIHFDETANHTFLATINLGEISGDEIGFRDGKISILARTFDVSGNAGYSGSRLPVADCLVSLDTVGEQKTDSNGDYLFTDILPGTYTLNIEKEGDLGSAIAGSDALALMRFLAFLETLTGSQKAAADVTQDSQVSGVDGLALLRYLAFFTTNIGQTGEWRFVPNGIAITGPPDVMQDFSATVLGDVTLDWRPSVQLAKRTGGVLAEIALPEQMHGLVGDTLVIPISVSTQSSIGLAQFVLEYDSSKVSFHHAQMSHEISGFSVALTNVNLPFSPTTDGVNKCALIQISGDGTASISGSVEVVNAAFILKGPHESETPLYFDRADKHTFLTTNDLEDLSGESILFRDGKVRVLATVSSANDNNLNTPSEFALEQNYPNPFNPETTLRYQLPQGSDVTLNIYNLHGQLVRKLVRDKKQAGYHEIVWDARDSEGKRVPSGVYLYRIKAEVFTEVKKLTLLK